MPDSIKSSISWYLQTPRKLHGRQEGLDDFTYTRVMVPSESKVYGLIWAWEIRYKGEFVTILKTKREVKEFIKEKLEN
jgi:hypothetical protein